MTTTEPFRGALTRRPATARDPFPSLRRTTSTKPNLALPAAASTAQAGPRARRAYRLRSLPPAGLSPLENEEMYKVGTPVGHRGRPSATARRVASNDAQFGLISARIWATADVTRAVNRLRRCRGQGSDHGHTSDRRRDPRRARCCRAASRGATPGEGSFPAPLLRSLVARPIVG